MPSVERSLNINASPERVYEAFVDHSRWLEWNPHLREVKPLSEASPGPPYDVRFDLFEPGIVINFQNLNVTLPVLFLSCSVP